MFGLTTTRRLRTAKLKIFGLQTQLGFARGFRQAGNDARRRAEQDLAAEIDAHLATIRQRLTAEQRLADQATSHREALNRQASSHATHAAVILRDAAKIRSQLEASLAAERRTTTSLAEQLLNATSGQSTAARQTLGLPETGPWERAVDGLNALVDAQIPFHIEPDGHISNPSGDEHIEWDRAAGRWRLVHDDETSVTITIDDTLGDALSAKGYGR
ncbi:hypothetical protein B1H20_16835 [Streptomyces violaceoruber]|uniref:Uncharacterized protein n=1 Tax=Streptomyces violaceoruber TaxID=1935 RepID=A0A1V0UD27_STRVN|nr:hypothetical protein [Streptomyces violaceoruber]ARF62868.1 hypothetical protein B1H20_16835 [Streptomyces violaceoruber]